MSTPLGQELRALAPAVLSQRAVHRFVGYMNSQRERLLGRGQRSSVPNRPDASHALRLAFQGLEIVRDGRLTLPMPPVEPERALAVKRGDVPVLDDVLAEIAGVQGRIERHLADGAQRRRGQHDARPLLVGDRGRRPRPGCAAIRWQPWAGGC